MAATPRSPRRRTPGSGTRLPPPRPVATEVIVVRRPELAAYPMLVARNAKVKAGQLDPIVETIVASVRGRPVTAK